MSVGSRYQDPSETWTEKFSRKFKENPAVPLGCLATCGALAMSAVRMRAGKSRSMNYWLRARVGLQGVTLVALVAGSMVLQKQKNAQISDLGIGAADSLPRNEATTELSREKKRILEQQEFEERLKDAQATTEQEQGVAMMIVKGPSVNKDRRVVNEENKPVQTRQPDASQSPVLNERKRSSWSWWSSDKNSGSDSAS